MRVAAVAASLAGALALTACSGDGGSDAEGDSGPSASASASADTGGGTGGSASASGGLEGSWLATTDGKAIALVVTGTEAALFSTGGTVCSGTAGEQDGMRMIRFKCPDGSKDRAVGMVDSVGKTRLKVTWQGEGGLGAETYTRAQGGKLPTGLATAGLGS
ncbi:hypothetical protein [Streptomyces sp. NPDC093591]|uniref:hypothetical protein n=1 Tax=Streptomyces sp. NPDC093591 TaxID=3366044 RepID=UPI0038278A02